MPAKNATPHARADTHNPPMRPPDDTLSGNLPQNGNPAALTPAVMAAIHKRVSPEQIAEGIEKLLAAKLSNEQPDVRAIEAGIKLYLNYTVGLPIQRQEIVTHKVTGQVDAASLLSNPATLEAIVRRLAGTEAGDKLKTALSKATERPVTAEIVTET